MSKKKKVVIGTIAVLVISLAVTFLVLYRKMYVKYYTGQDILWESPLISVATDENLSGKKGLLLIAHRGLSAIAPENTLPALQQACNYKYYGVEFDVYTTKDEVFILNHDETVDRMTEGVGSVRDMTYDELKALSFDSGNNRLLYSHDNLYIPTLDEALKLLVEYDIVPVIELKNVDVELLPEFVKLLDRYKLTDKSTIISFNAEYLDELAKIRNNLDMMYLVGTISDENIEYCKNNDFGLSFSGTNKDNDIFIEKCLEQEISLGTWTIDDPVRFAELYDMGIRMFTTNRITY
ncbi:MAG TPA: hypothetical protein GXZ23_00905 [Clostridiales bacterium]|nr:hypothetical protein [Clostridiales bacterium]